MSIIVFAIENVFNCVVLLSCETLKIQNGEYYDIFVRWELGLSAGNLGIKFDITNNK